MARDMSKWLGDGGMPLLAQLGLDITGFGEGSVEAEWVPTELACNPNGPVQGGVFGVVLDAAMTFATLSHLDHGEQCTTLEIKQSYLRGTKRGDRLRVTAEVTKSGRTVAFVNSRVERDDGSVAVEGSTTMLLFRRSGE